MQASELKWSCERIVGQNYRSSLSKLSLVSHGDSIGDSARSFVSLTLFIYLFIYSFFSLFPFFFSISFQREVAMSHDRAKRDFVLCRSSDLFRLGAFVR